MKKGRIGFVSISHEDYINDIVLEQTALAQRNIEELGFEVVAAEELVTDLGSAYRAGTRIACSEVDGVVLFLASWVECAYFMSVLREVEHLPLCLQCFPMCLRNGVEESTGSFVAYAMLQGTLNRVGYQYLSIMTALELPETKRETEVFCTAATAFSRLKRARVGLVGYTSMSIYPGTFDHVFMRTKVGPEIEQFDTYSLIRIAEEKTEAEKRTVIQKYRDNATIHREVPEEYLLKSAGLYLGLKELCGDRGLEAINVKCQYELSKEYKMVPCVPLSLIAEDGIVASCEGDILNTVSMLILHYLSGETVTYGDCMSQKGQVVKFSSCGFNPFSMGIKGEQLIRNFMPHPGFTGIECSFVIHPGRVTLMRLVEDQCSYHILYFTGEGLPTELRQGYMPALDVRLDGDVNELIKRFSGQHYAICFGDLSEKIEAVAKILNIPAIRV